MESASKMKKCERKSFSRLAHSSAAAGEFFADLRHGIQDGVKTFPQRGEGVLDGGWRGGHYGPNQNSQFFQFPEPGRQDLRGNSHQIPL